MLRSLAYADYSKSDESDIRKFAVLCIFLAVTVVETFLNVYFRVLVSNDAFKQHQVRIIEDLDTRKSLEYKISNWPKLLFNREFDQTKGVGKGFKELKDLRNKLMHFTSSHESLKINNFELKGLSDISFYHNLSVDDAHTADLIAIKTITELIRLSGVSEEQLSATLVHWTGERPA